MTEAVREMESKEAGTTAAVEHTRAARLYTPRVDIVERKDDIVLTAGMPGVDEHSVDITLEKNVLTVYGKVSDNAPEGYRLAHREYGTGDYQRTFTLSEGIDRERIAATVKNGVLTLVLPKAEEAKTKKIAVKAEK